MKISKNTDLDIVNEITKALKENDGYCPCRIQKTADTKCMCKEFRDMIKNGIEGTCHCGLYVATNDKK